MDLASTLSLCWLGIHLVGLVAAWTVQMQAGYRYEVLAQGCFFLCLVIISLATLVGKICCFEAWQLSAATLATMIVLAVIDFRVDKSKSLGTEAG